MYAYTAWRGTTLPLSHIYAHSGCWPFYGLLCGVILCDLDIENFTWGRKESSY